MTLYPQVQVRWFYHPAEVEDTAGGRGRIQDLEVTSNALFSSSHEDQNDVQTISHRCSLLELEVSSLRAIIRGYNNEKNTLPGSRFREQLPESFRE